MTKRIEFREGDLQAGSRPGKHVDKAELAVLEKVFQKHIHPAEAASPTGKARCHIISCIFEGDALVCYYHCH
jgi:hypothetical protein